MHDKCIGRRKCRRIWQISEHVLKVNSYWKLSVNICMAQHEKHYKITWFLQRSVQLHLFYLH